MERTIFISVESGVRQGAQIKHAHNCAELYVALEGRATDVVNGQETKTLPLDVFVLTKDVVHGQMNADGYRYCIFKFDMEALSARLADSVLSEGFQSLFVVEPALRREGKEVANMQIDPLTAEYAAATAMVLEREGQGRVADELFASLALLISANARPRGEGGAVAKAVMLMNIRYAEPITLSYLAQESGYSERHLSRIFTRLVGMPPMHYLNEVRLRRAAALLSEERLSVTEIAAAVGIGESSKFARRFRQKFGMTPTEYKKRSLGE